MQKVLKIAYPFYLLVSVFATLMGIYDFLATFEYVNYLVVLEAIFNLIIFIFMIFFVVIFIMNRKKRKAVKDKYKNEKPLLALNIWAYSVLILILGLNAINTYCYFKRIPDIIPYESYKTFMLAIGILVFTISIKKMIIFIDWDNK